MPQEHESVIVNGFPIQENDIAQEVQHHPAANLKTARQHATRALVIKELLLQRALALEVADSRKACLKNPNEIIDELLEREVTTPKADEGTCKRYYENNRKIFHTSPLFEVSHILLLSPPEDKEKKEEAFKKAGIIREKLQSGELSFKEAAKNHSQCSSAKDGGFLGQITKGQTLPAFEKVMFNMQPEEMSQPVETQVGWHIIYVHHREDGRDLPFDYVRATIEERLTQKSWEKAVQQYISLLAGQANIEGFELDGATSPLVQ